MYRERSTLGEKTRRVSLATTMFPGLETPSQHHSSVRERLERETCKMVCYVDDNDILPQPCNFFRGNNPRHNRPDVLFPRHRPSPSLLLLAAPAGHLLVLVACLLRGVFSSEYGSLSLQNQLGKKKKYPLIGEFHLS